MERFSWTYRQFVGGNAALDFANTVIYPHDDTRRFDRIVDAVELGRWVEAGVRFGALPVAIERRFAEQERGEAIRLRDSIDAVFRPLAGGQASSGETLAVLLRLSADAVARAPLVQAERGLALHSGGSRRAPFLAHVAISALALAFSPEIGRVKSCPACAWLFVDRSRNRRRIWCDMEVCGNRAKSQRHYARRSSARGRA
jgi:predicted RNA-binding Zn ribbon-like protein